MSLAAHAALSPPRLSIADQVEEALSPDFRAERQDEIERARGGKWRESELLMPDERVIRDRRLT